MKKHFFKTGITLFVTLFIIGCQMELESETAPGSASVTATKNAATRLAENRLGVQLLPSLDGTSWVGLTNGTQDDSGVSTLDFSDTDAEGVFRDVDKTFTYTFDASTQTGTLTEGTETPWNFAVTTDNTIIFNDMGPYGTNITFSAYALVEGPVDLSDLTDTLWIGLGPRGESLLDFISGSTVLGTFGPDRTNPFSYTYDGTMFTGTMGSGAGPFTASQNAATLTFSNFWGHEELIVFYLYEYL
jgi:hypothetical protein